MYKFLLIAFLTIIFYLAFSHPPQFISENTNDKMDHILAFMVLTCLSIQVFKKHPIRFVIFIGLFIEFIQYFIPFRTASFYDILADLVGLTIGCLIMTWFKYLRNL